MQDIPILFLEDDKALIRMYQTYLETKGYKSILIRNGQKGVEQAICEGPSLVTLKASSLTVKGKEAKMPIIIFTNGNQPEQYHIEPAIKSSNVLSKIKSTQVKGG